MTDVVRISRIIDAPLDFVYRWCTDYREDDYRITRSKSRRRILERTRRRVVYTTREKGKSVGSASIVTLHPSDAWHVNSIGDDRDIVGDYRLTKLAGGRTRLGIVFKVERKSPRAPSKSQFLKHINGIWDRYIARLEKDYRRHRE